MMMDDTFGFCNIECRVEIRVWNCLVSCSLTTYGSEGGGRELVIGY